MQYDAATIGNHDIEAGHQVYDKIKNEFQFPWLAANAINKNDSLPYFKPYVIINKDGIKIAILGLITPAIPEWLPEKLWEGIVFEDMVKSAKKWVPKIIQNESPDLLIGLFHSGISNSNYYSYEDASETVAEKVPGLDIIFVGHDHKTWNKKIVNTEGDTVFIFGPTSSARQLATATINFKLRADGKYEKNISGEIVEMKDIVADSIFNSTFSTQFNEVKKYVSRKVGEFEKTIYTQDAIYGPSEYLDLIHEIQLEISNADISIAAPQSFNSVIEKGPIYVRDMFKFYKYENFLYTLNLTGEEIDKYLEYSVGNWFNTMANADDHLLLFKKDNKGNLIYSNRYNSYELKNMYYNFDLASGINYTIDLTKPINDKVTIHSFSDNSIFNLDSTFTVAINSYRGNGGGGHLTNGVGLTKEEIRKRRINSTGKDLRFYMMKWIEKQEIVDIEQKDEMNIYPKDWWLKAKEKDKLILNRNNK